MFPVTNYSRNILELDVSPKAGKTGQIIYLNRNYRMYTEDLVLPKHISKTEIRPTYFKELELRPPEVKPEKTTSDTILPVITEPIRTPEKKHFTSVKLSEIRVTASLPRADTSDNNNENLSPGMFNILTDSTGKGWLMGGKTIKKDSVNKYKDAKQLNYDVSYYIDQMVTQIDFTYLNFAYQPFTGSAIPVFINPGLNGLFMVGITDLMEDYRITGGIRVNFNLINNEYLFSFTHYKKRLDHQITFHRKAVEEVGYYSLIRHKIHELYYVVTYPFNPVLNIKGTASVRYDRAIYLSTDLYNLQQPDVDQVWGSIKGELTYDNTRNLGLNLYRGTRYKIFGEYYQMLNTKGNNCIIVGIDFRNYQKVHRTLIWANRFAASTSFGSNKLIYYMGGVDNWLFPSFNASTPVAADQNYAFQTLATNLRGFNQNIRNGNSFFVFNTELRWPVFRYFYNRPIRSDFLNNFQIVAFGDVGTAWTGSSPWSSDNQLFNTYIYRKFMFINVEMIKDPLVGGFGFGARTRLFGYFLRADLAWGVEDGTVKSPIFYFSLSLDF
jgi:hypothetical protein